MCPVQTVTYVSGRSKLNQRKVLLAGMVGQIKCTVLIIEQYMLRRSEKPSQLQLTWPQISSQHLRKQPHATHKIGGLKTP